MSECASEDELLDHVEGRASFERSRSLLEHADACGACRLALADLVADGPRLASHATLGRFVVVRCLGAGGMGLVYEAHDPTLDRKVALKVLHRATSEADATRVTREAQAMARLSDPHVVHVYEVGVVDDQLFIAMELVEGETLADWLAAEPRSAAMIIRMFRSAGRGLAAAHAAGLVHRDFKPENVLVARSGRVLVGDFGLAAAPGDTRELAGTLAYLAPEQLAQGTVDARADQFSFCVALHEALYGTRPYIGANAGELRAAMLGGAARQPRGRGIPRRTQRALARGLAVSPADRFASMGELLDALVEPASRRARIVVAVLASAGLAGGVGLLMWARREDPDLSPPIAAGVRRYEAETARLLGPARINDNHTGASGRRFVDRLSPLGAGVEFDVEVATAGVKHLAIRYGDGGSSTKTASVYVNGARAGRIETPMLPDWDTWGTIELDVALVAGANRIAIQRDPSDNGGFNLDYIELR